MVQGRVVYANWAVVGGWAEQEGGYRGWEDAAPARTWKEVNGRGYALGNDALLSVPVYHLQIEAGGSRWGMA